MKTILHISASARGEESASYRLSRRMIAQLREQHPDARVVSRDLYAEPVPHIDSLYASTLARLPGGAPHAQGLSSLAWSDLLIEELKAADAVVIATPMHNFTVPSVLKAWLDHVVRIGVTFNATPQGKVGTLPDRRSTSRSVQAARAAANARASRISSNPICAPSSPPSA